MLWLGRGGGQGRESPTAGLVHKGGSFGFAKDEKRARAFFSSGCDAGDGDGCVRLGKSIEPDDVARAARLYAQGCDGDAPSGCVELGAMLLVGRGLKEDGKRATSLFQRAGDGGE